MRALEIPRARRGTAECGEGPRPLRLAVAGRGQRSLLAEARARRVKACSGQRRVHGHAQRAGIFADTAVAGQMRGHTGCVARQQLAVDVRRLRDRSHADQKYAHQRAQAQPKRPRPSLRYALTHRLHASVSMTQFQACRTRGSFNSMKIQAKAPRRKRALMPSASGSAPARSRRDRPRPLHPQPRRSVRPDPC